MTTPHTHPVIFGRKVDGCPRCAELAAGAAPVKGWGQVKREQRSRFLEDVRRHNCKTAGCGLVCTFGDW